MIEDSRERISHGLTQLRQTIWDELIENGQLTAVEIPVHLRCLSGSTAVSRRSRSIPSALRGLGMTR
jgi:hypothetical protein